MYYRYWYCLPVAVLMIILDSSLKKTDSSFGQTDLLLDRQIRYWTVIIPIVKKVKVFIYLLLFQITP